MRIVTAKEMQDWLSQGQVLEKDSRGVKVIQLDSGLIVKIMRSRRRRWLVRLMPAAQRFAHHATKLKELGIATPIVQECCWIDRQEATSACIYQPLSGQPLDKLLRDSRPQFDALLPELGRFIYRLHQLGIYFRSLHLGNILLVPTGNFGLIDFLDLRFKRRPLGAMQVRRNFQHLHNYLLRRKVPDFPWEKLLQAYDAAKRESS